MEIGEERSRAITPVWFDNTPLKNEKFDPEEYTVELSRYVSLDDVCAQLESYLAKLKLEVLLLKICFENTVITDCGSDQF